MSFLRTFMEKTVLKTSRASNRVMSEEQLRSMNHEQLIAYALQWLPTTTTPNKRSMSSTLAQVDIDLSHNPTHKEDKLSKDLSLSSNQKPKKKRKQFDMSHYGKRLIAIRFMYEGWRFHGFAYQIDNQNTVEHHLFSALIKTRLIESRDTCDYSRSGRTDVGVSALGQVVGLRVRSNVVPPSKGKLEMDYVKVINSCLPDGIQMLEWSPVIEGSSNVPTTYEGDPEAVREYWNAVKNGIVKESSPVRRPGEAFSARFDAIYRSYKYFFVKGDLNIKAMRDGAKYFEGSHDFRNFCKYDEKVSNFERLMYKVEIRRVNDDYNGEGESDLSDDTYTNYYIFVKGQAFLWHQVRCMASVLFDIGMGREEPNLVKQMLDDGKTTTGQFSNGRPQYRLASPIPLLLFECAYPKTVLHFPHAFVRTRNEGEKQDHVNQYASLERADSHITLSFAEQAAKMSILQAVLTHNDTIVSTNKHQLSEKPLSFKDCRKPRGFLMNRNVGKHIPFYLRQRDESIESRLKKTTEKRNMKQLNQ